MQSITRFNIAIGKRYRVLLYFLKDVLEILDHSVTKGEKLTSCRLGFVLPTRFQTKCIHSLSLARSSYLWFTCLGIAVYEVRIYIRIFVNH